MVTGPCHKLARNVLTWMVELHMIVYFHTGATSIIEEAKVDTRP